MFSKSHAERTGPNHHPTYNDVFEFMAYGRNSDVLPFVYAYRPRAEHLPPGSAEDPYYVSYVYLETEDEIAAFERARNSPVVIKNGMGDRTPLERWNDMPTLLSADQSIYWFCYPEDGTKGWPFLLLMAFPANAPVTNLSGQAVEKFRGRYQANDCPMADRDELITAVANLDASITVLSGDAWKSVPMSDLINRHHRAPLPEALKKFRK